MNTFIIHIFLFSYLATAIQCESIRGATNGVGRRTQLLQNAVSIAQNVAGNVNQSSTPQETLSEIVTNAQDSTMNVTDILNTTNVGDQVQTGIETAQTLANNTLDQVQTGIQTAQTLANSTLNGNINGIGEGSNIFAQNFPDDLPTVDIGDGGIDGVPDEVVDQLTDTVAIATQCGTECESECADQGRALVKMRCQQHCIASCIRTSSSKSP